MSLVTVKGECIHPAGIWYCPARVRAGHPFLRGIPSPESSVLRSTFVTHGVPFPNWVVQSLVSWTDLGGGSFQFNHHDSSGETRESWDTKWQVVFVQASLVSVEPCIRWQPSSVRWDWDPGGSKWGRMTSVHSGGSSLWRYSERAFWTLLEDENPCGPRSPLSTVNM